MSISDVGFSETGFTLDYVGFDNYQKALTVDPEFNRLLTEELTKIGTQVPFIIILSYFVALLVNQKFKFRGMVRAIFFLPVILSSGVLVGLEASNSLLSGMREIIENYSDVGRITAVLEELLLGGFDREGPVAIVLNAVNGIYAVMMASGIQILIFLAGLQAIPSSLYEAARIDGSSSWETFWLITLPMSSSLIIAAVVYSIVDTCIRTDSALLGRIRDIMLMRMDFGLSAAMAWTYFIAIIAIMGVVIGILSKVVFYDE
jgi:ABC-type sugar transport system permease subunit